MGNGNRVQQAAPPNRPALYDPLPKQLGGTGVSPSGASLAPLLPTQPGTNAGPDEAALAAAIEHKGLQLEGGNRARRATKSASRGNNKRGDGADEGARVRPGGDAGDLRAATRRRAKRNGFRLPRAEARHALYAPLRALWLDYARRALGDRAADISREALGDRLLRLDLHGAELAVVRATDPSLVGAAGTVVAETAHTLVVVTRGDRALTIPKRAAVVRVTLGAGRSAEYTLSGLCMRASERSAKKIKKRQRDWL